jgi:hypothetical protein
MSSPFTAEIIRFRPARPMQGRGAPPRPDSARVDPAFKGRPVLDIGEMAQATRDAGMQSAVREIEARLNGAARHVAVPPIRPTTAERIILQRWIGLACCIFSALVVLYFGAELARAVWS